MGNIDLASLLVGVVCGVGMVELIMWTLVVIRHPGYDYLRLDLGPNTTSNPPEESGT